MFRLTDLLDVEGNNDLEYADRVEKIDDMFDKKCVASVSSSVRTFMDVMASRRTNVVIDALATAVVLCVVVANGMLIDVIEIAILFAGVEVIDSCFKVVAVFISTGRDVEEIAAFVCFSVDETEVCMTGKVNIS